MKLFFFSEKNPREISYFSEGLINEGKIKFSGTLKIDGQFTGEIEGLSSEAGGLLSTDFLIIGPTAKVKGKISVSKLEVYGTLEGDIFVTGKITIFKSGTVKGSLVSPVVSIQEGATVEMSLNQNKTVLTPGWSDRLVSK
jgi:cytoskeletal protein CcmA (bactofilin family)